MALSGTSDVARPVRRLPYPRNPRNPRSVFGTVRAGYSYLANSARVGQIGFTNNGNWRMTTTQAYDAVNRLTEVSSAPAGANAGTYCCAYDANGNVMGLVSAADGSVAARYEYGPFGELIRATGPMAKVNPFRFSTKYQDEETGLVYYGYRYYDPGTGRWLNRDPINELGHRTLLAKRSSRIGADASNLYEFVHNNPINWIDPSGLTTWRGSCDIVSIALSVGWMNITCYLESGCGVPDRCSYQWVRVSANMIYVGFSIPASVTSFDATFTTPGNSDCDAFRGMAVMASASVAVGGGVSAGKIGLGEAESNGWASTQTGLDLGVGWAWAPWGTNVKCKTRDCDPRDLP